MGSSSNEREGGAKSIDASVGGLVWVRRRNGSWWPGRIMGLDELSESCLVSPRSGTPVKLLGREDASVDWYNLEKSKRVKPFRCGEYDECIEKAKASAANPNKKTVKYARREDAIIHALELENARLGKDPLDFCSRTNNSGGEHSNSARESHSISFDSQGDEDVHCKGSDSEDNSDSALELRQPGISLKEPSNDVASKTQSMEGKRRRTPNDSEDDGSGGIKRMRGLQDLGMGVASRNAEIGGALELAQQDSPAPCESSAGHLASNGSPVNSSKSCPSLKKKRSQMAHSHELLKKKNRRRPLTQVLESTSMVSIPIMCDQLATSSGLPLQGLADNKVSGLESNGSKKNFPMVKGTEVTRVPGLAENDSSDKLFDVPFVGEEKDPAGGAQGDALGGQSSQSCQAEAVSLGTEVVDEIGFTSPAAVNDISQQIEKGTSKWQSKGKRNSRHLSKDRKKSSRKYMDVDDESDACLAGVELSDEFSLSIDQKVAYGGTGGSYSTYNGNAVKVKREPVTEDRLDRCWDWSKRIPRRDSQMRGLTPEVKPLADFSLAPQRSLPYRHSRFTVPSRYRTEDTPGRSFCSGSALYDVEVEVNSNYRPRHVPLVSLMSKLNGKAIIGHPLTVDILGDGLSDALFLADSKAITILDPPRGSNVGFAVKPLSDIGRTPGRHVRMDRRFPRNKSSKAKKIGLQSKKIRKLSSLTGHRSAVGRKPMVEKPIKQSVIACVPVKITYSRIAEGVQGSARPGQHVLISGDP